MSETRETPTGQQLYYDLGFQDGTAKAADTIATLTADLAQARQDAASHLERANQEIARRERAEIAYTQSEQKRLVIIYRAEAAESALAACHHAVGESEHSDHETLAEGIALRISERDQRIARLESTLRAAQQERDAAQKAMSYCSNQAHLEWTRANKAEGDLKSAQQDALRAAAEDIPAQFGGRDGSVGAWLRARADAMEGKKDGPTTD